MITATDRHGSFSKESQRLGNILRDLFLKSFFFRSFEASPHLTQSALYFQKKKTVVDLTSTIKLD